MHNGGAVCVESTYAHTRGAVLLAAAVQGLHDRPPHSASVWRYAPTACNQQGSKSCRSQLGGGMSSTQTHACIEEEESYTVSTTADMRCHAHFPYDPDMSTSACTNGKPAYA
jgi:hypothetical protein